MFGYIGSLRTITSGRGQFSMECSHYMPCPQNVAEEVIAEIKECNAKKYLALISVLRPGNSGCTSLFLSINLIFKSLQRSFKLALN